MLGGGGSLLKPACGGGSGIHTQVARGRERWEGERGPGGGGGEGVQSDVMSLFVTDLRTEPVGLSFILWPGQ